MTRMRSESERISSSSSETRKTARPLSRCSTSLRCTNSIAPTSRPRVGWAAIRTFGLPSISRASTTFCWLPPESAEAGVVGVPPRTSNSRRSRRARSSIVPSLRKPLREFGGAGSRAARGSRSARTAARARAGGGPPGCGRCRRRATGVAFACVTSCPSTTMRPDAGERRPAIASISSLWPFASTPARPRISPARTSKLTSRTASSPRSSITVRFSTAAAARPGVAGVLVDAQQHLAPDHHPRETLLGRALGRDRVDDDAAPQRRDPVGDLEHLVQLVRDEDDRLALRSSATEDLEELLRLLRRQHGGRLVEDQDLRAAVERLQDLDALLLADRDAVDARVRDRRRGRSARRARARACVRRRSRAARPPCRGSMASTMFSATVITGISMKCWCTIPIPCSIAAFVEPRSIGLPFSRISPSSGV